MDWPPPESVFTPFFRRFFVNETRREVEETRRLYNIILAHQRAFEETAVTIANAVYPFYEHIPEVLQRPLDQAIVNMAQTERYIFDLPPFDPNLSLAEWTNFRTFLRHKEYFFANREKILDLVNDFLVREICSVIDEIPQAETPSPFTIPLIYAMAKPGDRITQLFVTICGSQYRDAGVFAPLRERLYYNLCDASGIVPEQPRKKPFLHAEASKLPPNELCDTYLSGTPFRALYDIAVPLKFTHEDRFNHMHIIGGTGAGKTTLLKNLILHDLTHGEPALVIVDSQGDLIRDLSHLRVMQDRRFVLITPKDIKYPPALNIFDVNRSRIEEYDELTKEQVIAGVIQTFDYLFSGLLGADLTAKQGVFFKYVARLMLALPETMGRNATILDMMNLMDDPAPYKNAIASLPPIQRNFFERDFNTKTFQQTKEQIRYRLSAIIENPTLARLFTSPRTKIDLFTELNEGSIILVDTAKDFLKGSSSHFGRIFISLVLQAVLERAAIPESERKPAFLIVDEAASYFDSNIDDLLTEARKYKCGCVFAHQYLDQATPSLKASFAANTGIKFAAGLSTNDARQMAPDMRTTADFILSQPALQFAAHIRNVTSHAVSIPVSAGKLEREPQLSNEAYQSLIERNRDRVSLREQSPDAPLSTHGVPEDSDHW